MISGVDDDRARKRFSCRYDTVIGQDALIEPNVVFGPGAVIDGGAVIHAFSHIEGAHVERRCDGRSLCAAAAGRRSRREVRRSATSAR